MNPWVSISSQDLLSEPVRIVRERLRTQQGHEITYIYRPGPAKAVFVLPITTSGQVLLVHQYRHPTGGFLLELPAGKVEQDETPRRAAERELLEEVGAEADDWVSLPFFRPQPSFTAVVFYPFIAFSCHVTKVPRLEEGELLEPRPTPLEQVYHLLREGRIEDAASSLTLFHALPILKERSLVPDNR